MELVWWSVFWFLFNCFLVMIFFFAHKTLTTPGKQAFVPKPVIQRLKKIPYWKLPSINQYSTDCSVGKLSLLCWMWVPAAPASLSLATGDLYILNWRKPVSSHAASGVCSSLQTATSFGGKDCGCVCPAQHHAFIIHREHYRLASFSNPLLLRGPGLIHGEMHFYFVPHENKYFVALCRL